MRGWCEGTGGNFSVVLSREPLQLLISSSGTTKYRLFPDDLVLVDERGEVIGEQSGRPSDETALHCKIALLAGAGSVLHTHSISGTLLGEHFESAGGFHIQGYEMLKGIDGTRSHDDRIFVPVVPNSQDMGELGDSIGAVCSQRPATRGVLVAGHGLYAWGRDIDEAQRHVEIFEFLFECLERRTRFTDFNG